MDNDFKIDALSAIVTQLEGEVKERMLEINGMLSCNSYSENLTSKLKRVIVELSTYEQSLSTAKNLLNQALASRMEEIRIMKEKFNSELSKNEKNID